MKQLEQQYGAENIGPLLLYVDARKAPVCSPEAVSKALIDALNVGALQRLKRYIGNVLFKSIVSSFSIKLRWFDFDAEAQLSKTLRADILNLDLTTANFDKILSPLKSLPQKPVIIIGALQNLCRETKQKKRRYVFFPLPLIFFHAALPY
jgi:hypothetical protein